MCTLGMHGENVNQLVSQTVYIHTQMVIVEGCPFIDFSPPPLPFKYFVNEGLISVHVL